jgi:alkanesulfonate monooxygenase SsuD/methylene tetrahydromethanopterin reductase-like flavin-dependent oxidoreductase (luciferase family)
LIATIEHIRCETKDRPVRILVGGKGPRSTLPVAARYADEWNLTTSSVAEFQSAAARLDALCAESNRDPGEIQRSVAAGLLIGRDMRGLEQRAARMARCVPPATSLEAAREMGWMVGTREDIASHVHRLAEAGVDRVIFGHYDLDDLETLSLLAEALL